GSPAARPVGARGEASPAARAPTDPDQEGVPLRLDGATVERARQTVLEEEQRHQPARGTRDVVHAVNDESAVRVRRQGVHAPKPPPALHDEGATRSIDLDEHGRGRQASWHDAEPGWTAPK